ncbi:hypothetical protein OIU83_17695 [Flavobacterium sp. LS1R49]|uniref:Uncharacterized protein n=1 Tax=Flavobacterium shii TaxID=2987687 RepID=A0A9X2ZE98_9FLAO|nr:hypothetical protein [Flavobacterium shii]MCV9929499.1 hypothetical protein [Flavobacterium shii]
MTRQEEIAQAYKDCEYYVKEKINNEGWVPHRFLLDLLCFYHKSEIDVIGKELVRPKKLRQ